MRPNAPAGRPKLGRFVTACAIVATFATLVACTGSDEARVPATPAQPAVIIVGDSLTADNESYIAPTLLAAGLDVRIEALSARRIAESYEYFGRRDSGVERVQAVKAEGVAPSLWVVELGTNDLASIEDCACPDPVAFAGAIIDQLLNEIGPDVPIAWVTVLDQSRPEETAWFNAAIGERAATDPYISLIGWSDLAQSQPDWFQDSVHPNSTGATVFAQMYVDNLTVLLADLPGP